MRNLFRNYTKLSCVVVLALASELCTAQQATDPSVAVSSDTPVVQADVDTQDNAAASSNGDQVTKAPAAKSAGEVPLFGRWLDLETLSHSERYRNAITAGGNRLFDNFQQRSLIVGKIKLDSEGRYAIGFRASSGRYFNWAYGSYTGATFLSHVLSPRFSNSSFYSPADKVETSRSIFTDPAGLAVGAKVQSNGWEFYMRDLYFSATPIKQLTIEFGSFSFDRGLSTEITTFDEDGYLTGERVHLHDSKHLFFDEIGFTNAFFGEIGTPNLFGRGLNLTNSNYRQILAVKQLTHRIGVSGEYNWQMGMNTVREAAVVGTKESKAVDSVKVEIYHRLNSKVFAGAQRSVIGPIPSMSVPGASGFAISGQKKWGKLSADLGYASVDKDYAVYAGSRFFHAVSFTLNGDNYGIGDRIYTHLSYKVAPGLTAFGFFTHEIGGFKPTFNQQGVTGGLTFDVKEMVNQAKRVF